MSQKKLLIAMLCLTFALLFVGLTPVHGEERIYDSVIRLHILANSDSEVPSTKPTAISSSRVNTLPPTTNKSLSIPKLPLFVVPIL